MTPADRVLVIILLVLSLLSYAIIVSLFPADIPKTAVIEINGKEVKRFSLNRQIPPRRVPLHIDRGEAVFEVSDGRIRILPMPDKICSKHICSKKGWIEKPWDMIVCMPNKIVVRIIGEKDKGDIDLITR
ncbi:MAG: NusG domain II-containing protein [Deltaproteobacteria bacterium]|nr:NusG domain II-containing protein [Deltaproteobacteria bacterium]